MVTINYYLKGAISEKNLIALTKAKDASLNKDLNKPLQVYLTLSGLGKRLQIYTKKRVSQYCWDKRKQEVDPRRNKINANELNTWFKDFKEEVIILNSRNENDGKTTSIADLHKVLNSMTPAGALKVKTSFKEYYERFLTEHKTNEGHSKRRRTVQKYASFYKHLNNFAIKKEVRTACGDY